jgi:hypothetical protein
LGEHLGLVARSKPRIERQHDSVPWPGRFQQLLGFVNLTFAWQKHQDVAARIERRDVGDRRGRSLGQFELFGRRLVQHLHPERSSLHRNHRRAREELRKAFGFQRCRAHDQLQVSALRQNALEPAQQEIDVQAALVSFVDDQRVVAVEQRIVLDLRKQDAVGHELDPRLGARAILEADLIADLTPELTPELLCNTRRHAGGRDAPRLRHANLPIAPAPGRKRHLR